ncbi:hypothetical protein HDU87_000504 [Geranomyces variabilis]|uniref:Cytochrome b5 heme-binding domain-containing protein n=1 Tax=Geranomyces variabilis TaxID=109894 RepID=A0AAD5TCK4_9FUNG|nr:hypothetical protein HDU87_000504 [Geranomyces variabilis]
MQATPPPLPQFSLELSDSEEEETDGEDGETINLETLTLTEPPAALPPSLSLSPSLSSSSSLSPSSAHTARPAQPPPSDGFKVPFPVDKESRLNAFPMLGGPQRAGGSGSGLRRKVPLAPGCSPLDWARLLTSGRNMRGGVQQLARYTPEELAEHRKRDDIWMALQGKVYNVTQYLKFHPGGAGQLMRGAGKDATELFMKVHPWVNVDGLLEKCHVGYLVKER